MSFDIFLMPFRKGEPAPFKRKVLEDVFLPHCANPGGYKRDSGIMQVEYSDGGGGTIWCGLGPEIEHVMFNHCGGEAFFEDMYVLADRTGAVIFWPSHRPIYVFTNEAVPQEWPEGFVSEKVRLRLARKGTDITAAIADG